MSAEAADRSGIHRPRRLYAVADSAVVGLAGSAGYAVVADDGVVGAVERPLFPPDRVRPDFLVVRVRAGLRLRYPVVSAHLVTGVDMRDRVVRVRGTRRDVRRLPELLPLAI